MFVCHPSISIMVFIYLYIIKMFCNILKECCRDGSHESVQHE